MMNNYFNSKIFWQKFGISIGLLTFLFSTLFLLSFFSRKSCESGLKTAVETILEEKEDVQWIVGKKVYLNSPIESRAALFELREKNSVEKNYVIIIRIATLFGHMPAVYIYNKNTGARFVGYTGVKGKVRRILDRTYTDSSMTYWTERIPTIVKTAEGGMR